MIVWPPFFATIFTTRKIFNLQRAFMTQTLEEILQMFFIQSEETVFRSVCFTIAIGESHK